MLLELLDGGGRAGELLEHDPTQQFPTVGMRQLVPDDDRIRGLGTPQLTSHGVAQRVGIDHRAGAWYDGGDDPLAPLVVGYSDDTC